MAVCAARPAQLLLLWVAMQFSALVEVEATSLFTQGTCQDFVPPVRHNSPKRVVIVSSEQDTVFQRQRQLQSCLHVVK